MRIFWPTDTRRSELSGVVVGWRNSLLDVFVVAILEEVDVRTTPRHLSGRLLTPGCISPAMSNSH